MFYRRKLWDILIFFSLLLCNILYFLGLFWSSFGFCCPSLFLFGVCLFLSLPYCTCLFSQSLCLARLSPLRPPEHPLNGLFVLLWSCGETQVTALKSAVTAGPLAPKRSSSISQKDSARGRERKALLCC